jgi:hypothetical protein
MNSKEQENIKDDQISFIDALLFLKASGRNIVKCTVASLLAGGAYYLFAPTLYKASATIELASVEGEKRAAAAAVFEKMKLPMYFSPSTQQVCGSDGELDSKIKMSADRITPRVSFVTHAQSTIEAKACIHSIIAEVSNNLDLAVKTLTEEKKQVRQQFAGQLRERLKLVKEKYKKFPAPKSNNSTDEQISAWTFCRPLVSADAIEINVLLTEIIKLDREMVAPPPSNLVSLVGSVHAPEISTNKRPLFILGFCLSIGLIFGLLLTWMMRLIPSIWRQMREAESSAN